MKTAADHLCKHCGTHFDPLEPADEFCCGGCSFVHQLIHDSGFDQYYNLKGAKVTAPVKSVAFQKRDYTWLTESAHAAELAASNGAASLDLAVQGISCVGCVWLLERVFLRTPGALRASVRAHPGRIRLEWNPGNCDIPAFADSVRQFGYLLGPVGAENAVTNEFSGRTGLCGAFAMNAMAFSLPRYLGMENDFALAGIFTMAAGVCATLAVLTGGSYFIGRAIRGLRCGVLHIDLPIAAELDIPPQNSHASLTPTEKEQVVRSLDRGDTLYIGDGMNDTLAFSAASCTGTPVVDKGLLEAKADFYFLGRSLKFLTTLLDTAKLRAKAVHRVAAFAVTYNIAAAGLCLAGLMNPLLAAILMPLSGVFTLAVVAAHFATPIRR